MEDRLSLSTTARSQMLDITENVRRVVSASGVRTGLCLVYSMHTTAGITVNEHADPDVAHDLLWWLDSTVPKRQEGFRHREGNSDSHIKAVLVGTSATLLVRDGLLVLGTWQGVFFCEFDGPRRRRCLVRVVPDATAGA